MKRKIEPGYLYAVKKAQRAQVAAMLRTLNGLIAQAGHLKKPSPYRTALLERIRVLRAAVMDQGLMLPEVA